MITVYAGQHGQHNPPYEIYDGVPVAYAESAARAEAIIEAIRSSDQHTVMAPKSFPLRHITAIHQPGYVDYIRRASRQLTDDAVLYPSYFMTDTYAPVVAGTYVASKQAVDCALTGADLVLFGQQAVYSLCRPPGHHASHHSMGGYCYFNNAAIAANYLAKHGKVAILDIDFHHGNGTQDIFYDRSDVLYVSIHADPQTVYPYIHGFSSETGRGDGLGFTRNFPLELHTEPSEYIAVLEKALGEIAVYNPDFLVVSAGFDTLASDPIGGLNLTVDTYLTMGSMVDAMQLRTLIIQEGGYDTAHLGQAVTSFLQGFSNNI